jgi:hypothetical protein
MSKTSTTLALASLVTVLLSTVVIGSTSASSKVFSNSGTNIKTVQNCTAGDSCTLSSSNVITQQPGSTTPSPSLCQAGGTLLSLSVVGNNLLTGSLVCDTETFAISGATITFTGTGVPHNPNFVATTANDGQYFMSFSPPTTSGTYTVQAHFAGLPGLNPSDSQTQTFTVP